MTRSVAFWNAIAGHYARQPIADEVAYQHKVALTQRHLHSDTRLLEFGCGTGSTALIHAPLVAHIDAIDYSRKMIAFATAKAQAASVSNVTFEVATIEQWAEDRAPYDVILGLNILHLVQDKAAVLAKVRRLIKPGGMFISSSVCLAGMGGVVKWLLPIGSALRLLPKLGSFSASELTADITRAGFVIEHLWYPAPDKAAFVIARAV
jgi:2-polyprenyl-3-methyl-5-hydroxy-6-metoxy-1,4-benzoquinol methylase